MAREESDQIQTVAILMAASNSMTDAAKDLRGENDLIEVQSGLIEVQSGSIEVQSGLIEVQSDLIEVRSDSIEVRSGSIGALTEGKA